MKNVVLPAIAFMLISTASEAAIEEFKFSFGNTSGQFNGIVRVDTIAAKATALYFTEMPSKFNYSYGADYDFLAHSNNVVYNTFYVVNSQVAFVDYGTGINFGTPNDYQLGLYQDRSEFIHSGDFFSFPRATFTFVPAVPLPASAPMFGAALLGFAGLSYAAKRKKAAAAA